MVTVLKDHQKNRITTDPVLSDTAQHRLLLMFITQNSDPAAKSVHSGKMSIKRVQLQHET